MNQKQLLAVLVMAACTSGPKQPSPYDSYASAISETADSVISLAHAVNLRQIAGTLPIVGRTGNEMGVLARDFEAHMPPADLVTLHSQLATSLNTIASDFERLGSKEALYCEEDLGECRASMTVGVGFALADVKQYLEGRDRAARMLAEHGTQLHELDPALLK